MRKLKQVPKVVQKVPRFSRSHVGTGGGFFYGSDEFIIVAKDATTLEFIARAFNLNPGDTSKFKKVAVFNADKTVQRGTATMPPQGL